MAFNLGTIWAEIGLNTKKLDDGLMKAQTKLATADKQVNTMGQSLTRNSTKFMVAGGIMAGAVAAVGVASIKSAKEFDTSMRNVNSIAQLSEKEFANMSKQVVDLSKKLPQSAKVLADGLYDISSSGFQGADGLKVLEAAAKAASAGMTDTATSAKGITAVLNAYGKSAEEAAEVSDTMFATVDKGVITFEELSGGIGNVLSTANLAGIEFNELSGMIAYMTTKGVSADETMTALNRLILNIIKPSEQLAEVLYDAGYESGEMALKAEGLTGVLTLMEEASGGSLTKLQELSPEMRALKASGALLGGGIKELTGYMADFKDTTGATQKALDEQSKSLDYQLDLLKNNIDAIKITLGTELIPNITKTTESVSDWISKNSELTTGLIKLAGGGIGGAGLLLLTANAIGKIRGAIILLNATKLGLIGSGSIAAILAMIALLAMYTNSIYHAGDANEELYKKVKEKEKAENDAIIAEKNRQVILEGKTQTMRAATDAEKENLEVIELSSKDYWEYAERQENAKKAILNTAEAAGQAEAMHKSFGQQIEKTGDKVDKTTDSLDEQKEAVDELRDSFNALVGDLFDGINANNELQESQWALEEAQKAVSNAEKELKEAQSKTGSIFIKNDGALQAYLSTNIDYLENQQKQATLQEKLNKFIKDGDTSSLNYLKAQESLNTVITEGNKIIEEAAKKTGTYNSTGKQTEEQMLATQEAAKEYEKSINELDSANQDYLSSLHQVYTSVWTTEEAQESARIKAIDFATELYNTGQIGKEAYELLSQQFNVTKDDIVRLSDDIIAKLKEVDGVEVRPAVDLNTTAFNDKLLQIRLALSRLNSTTSTIEGSGLTFNYASGGIVGMPSIPQAATGMVLPQTGRAIPILAHEGEMILNSSQQGNLIDALWGVANGKQNVSNDSQPIAITNVFEVDGQVIYQKTSEYLYKNGQTTRIGAGIR